MVDWTYECISGEYFPRQFEFHPENNTMIFGTVFGEVCSVDLHSKAITSFGYKGLHKRDSILGLRWLKQDMNHLFVTGTGLGKICLADASQKGEIVQEFPKFDKLTSVHLNCTNERLLISGYSNHVAVYDMNTAQVMRELKNIHTDHINISRFCNLSPHIFSTSSFDGTIKTWDLRLPGPPASDSWLPFKKDVPNSCGPIYTLKCSSGVVMINFSADDNFILASALDNEINQYLFVDGKHHLKYDLPSTGLKGNFTRAYYSASGKYTITGACEEKTAKFLCSYTGDYLASVEMYPERRDRSLYIQSLRGSPHNDNELCVLVNYRDLPHRELIFVRGNQTGDGKEAVGSGNQYAYEKISSSNGSSGKSAAVPMEVGVDEHINIEKYLPFTSLEYGSNMYKLRTALWDHSSGEQQDQNIIFLQHQQVFHQRQLHADSIHALGKSSFSWTADTTASSSSSERKFNDVDQDLQLLADKTFFAPSYALHAYVALARCPFLYDVYRSQLESQPSSGQQPIELEGSVALDDWYVLSLVIDYLYTGYQALEIVTLRLYALMKVSTVLCKEDWNILKDLLTQQVAGSVPHEINRVDFLVMICTEDHVWRNLAVLSKALFDVIAALQRIAKTCGMKSLESKTMQLFSDVITTTNVLHVWERAVMAKHAALQDFCVVFAAKHAASITLSPSGYNLRQALFSPTDTNVPQSPQLLEWIARVQALLQRKSPIVSTRVELEQYEKQQQEAISYLPVLSGSGKSLSSNSSSSLRQLSDTWQFEELPFVVDKDNEINRIAISKMAGHGSAMLGPQDDIVFFGGMTRERYHPLSKLLVYYVSEDRFSYVDCVGSRIPVASNLSSAVSLQKTRSQHAILIGGKMKRSEKAECKASASTNVAWHVLQRANLNAQSAKRKLVGSIANIDEEEEVQENTDESIIENGLLVNEFDYSHLTWHMVPVKVDYGLTEDELRQARYRGTSASVHMEDEDEEDEEHADVVRQANRRHITLNIAEQKKALAVAFSRRICQTITPIYLDDIPYRCGQCLFASVADKKAGLQCLCSTNVHSSTAAAPETPLQPSYVLQFGGYCTKREAILKDIHVLTCTPKHVPLANAASADSANTPVHTVYSYSWQQIVIPGNDVRCRFSHSAVFIPPNKATHALSPDYARILFFGGTSYNGHQQDLLSLRINRVNHATGQDVSWEEVDVNGPRPTKRHNHTMNYAPDSHQCILFGGIADHDTYVNDVWVLRWTVDHLALKLLATWTKVDLNQALAPSPRSKHTTHYITFGGTQRSSNTGVSGKPQATEPTGALFIFGGVNESIETSTAFTVLSEDRIMESVMHKLMHYDTREDTQQNISGTPDSSKFLWEDHILRPSRVLYMEHESAVPIFSCTLNIDMENLVFAKDNADSQQHAEKSWRTDIEETLWSASSATSPNPFLPTLTFLQPSFDDGSSSSEAEKVMVGYRSLIQSRCPVLQAMLTSSMLEAQTGMIHLPPETDLHRFKKMLDYLCADSIHASTLPDLIGLLEIGNEYGVTSLIKKCEGALLRTISDATVCEILTYADWLNLSLLTSACYTQLLRNPDVQLLISKSICDQEFAPVGMALEEEPQVEEEPQEESLLDTFKTLPVDLKMKFRTFALQQSHVFAWDAMKM